MEKDPQREVVASEAMFATQVRVHLQPGLRVVGDGARVPRRGRVPRQPARVPPRPLPQLARRLRVRVRARLPRQRPGLLRRRRRVRRQERVPGTHHLCFLRHSALSCGKPSIICKNTLCSDHVSIKVIGPVYF